MLRSLLSSFVASALLVSFAAATPPSSASKAPSASERMHAAHMARATWGKNFPGFTAQLEARIDDRVLKGTLQVAAGGQTKVEVDNAEASSWARTTLHSLVMHRAPGREPSSEPYPPDRYQFGESAETHPLGRMILAPGEENHSSYRVRDNQILQVNRDTGKSRFTINVLENTRNAEGKYLPRAYTVTFWDSKTGAVQRTNVTHEEWKRVGRFDLPSLVTVVTSGSSERTVRQLRVSDHQLGTTQTAKKDLQ